MNPHLAIELEQTELWLLADKAAYLPSTKAVLVADVHFGKAAAFRLLGQPVPQGTTQANLRRLDAILTRYPARELVFLGDFLHAAESRTPAIHAQLLQWRRRHAGLEITLVRGNHDLRAGDPPVELGMRVVAEPLPLGPFALQHEPVPHPDHHVLAGHLHPSFRLRGRGRQQLSLPCFCIGERVSLLPAFGSFTGTMNVDARQWKGLYVTGDEGIWQVR